MVLLENVLLKSLGKSIGYLIMSANWINLDQPRVHVLPEMIITTHIDVLGARAELWQKSQLQSS
jgi:hypothetical protein